MNISTISSSSSIAVRISLILLLITCSIVDLASAKSSSDRIKVKVKKANFNDGQRQRASSPSSSPPKNRVKKVNIQKKVKIVRVHPSSGRKKTTAFPTSSPLPRWRGNGASSSNNSGAATGSTGPDLNKKIVKKKMKKIKKVKVEKGTKEETEMGMETESPVKIETERPSQEPTTAATTKTTTAPTAEPTTTATKNEEGIEEGIEEGDDNTNRNIEPGNFDSLNQRYNLLGDGPTTTTDCNKVLRTFTVRDLKYIMKTFFAEVKALLNRAYAATGDENDNDYYYTTTELFNNDVFQFTLEELEKTEVLLISQIEYAVQIRTICARCSDDGIADMIENKPEFDTFCGASAYEEGSLMSGTLFVPVEQYHRSSEEYSIVREKIMDSFLYFRNFNFAHADSEVQLLSWYLPQIYIQLLSSSKGSVSLSFHQSGYVTSNNLTPSPLIRKSVAASSLPLFYKAQQIVSEETFNKSNIGGEASFAGYGEGGYSAISAVDTFMKQGITPKIVFSGGAPLKMKTVGMLYPLRIFFDNTDYYYYYYGSSLHQLLLPHLIGLPLTIDRDVNPSARTDVYLGSQNFLQAVGIDFFDVFTDSFPSIYFDPDGWYQDLQEYLEGSSTVKEYTKLDALVSGLGVNGALGEMWRSFENENSSDPCSVSNSPLSSLCAVLSENDLSHIVESANYQMRFCHSIDDELISYHNLPNQFVNPEFVSVSNTVGSHYQAQLICSLELLALLSEIK